MRVAMTPADKLAAVVAAILSPETDWDDGEVGVGHRFRVLARELQPILAELQRAQGRLTEEQVRELSQRIAMEVDGFATMEFRLAIVYGILSSLLSAPTPADMDESIVPNPTWESDDALGVPREWRESHPAPATTATPEEKK